MTNSEKLDLLLGKVDGIESDVKELQQKVQKLDTIESDLKRTMEKLDIVESDVKDLQSDVKDLQSDVKVLQSDVRVLQRDVKDIKLTIENELRVSIKRVAEGHLDLSRHLHEAIEIHSEREMMAVRVSILETEVHKLKRRYENIA